MFANSPILLETFKQDILKFKMRPGMYINPPSYSRISTFLQGINHQAGYNLLGSFSDWLERKYTIKDALIWENSIKSIFDKLPHRTKSDEELVQFLFENILEYLEFRENNPNYLFAL